MTASKSLSVLFKEASKAVGPTRAKGAVSDILFIVLDNILEEGLEVDEYEIEKRLELEAEELLACFKKDVA